MASFLTDGILCREDVRVMVCPLKKEDLRIQTRPLQSSGRRAPWNETQYRYYLAKKKKKFPPSITFKLWRIELRVVDETSLEKVAVELKRLFQNSNRVLVGLRLEVNGARELWKDSTLVTKIAEFELAIDLGLKPGALQETFDTIKAEFKNFD